MATNQPPPPPPPGSYDPAWLDKERASHAVDPNDPRLKPPAGYVPDPSIPPGYTPQFDGRGNLYGYLDPNGVNVSPDKIKTAVANPQDGTITYPSTGGSDATVVTRPDGTSVVSSHGLQTVVGVPTNGPVGQDALGVGHGGSSTNVQTGQRATQAELDYSAAQDDALGGGGILGIAANNPVEEAWNAATGIAKAGATGIKSAASGNPYGAGGSGSGSGSGASGGAGPTGPLSSLPAVKQASDFATDLLKERNADQPRAAPQATYNPVDISQIPLGSKAATYGGDTSITTTPVARSTIGPAGSFSVGGVGGGGVTAGKIDPHGDDISLGGEARDAQVRALNLAEGAANGTAPSQAEALLRKGIDEGVGSQLGVAATLQGRNPAAALRAGLTGAANVTAKSSADMAGLRAEEMATARRDFLSGAQGLRTSDVDVQKANQNTALQANLGNLSADTQAKIATLQSQTQAAVASLNAQVAAGQANLAAQTQVQVAQLQADMQKAHDDAWNELQGKIASGQLSLDSFKATLAANTQLSVADIDAMTRIATTNATNQTTTNTTNVDATLKARQLDDLLKSGQGDQIIKALGLPIDAGKQDIANAIAAKASDNTFWASLIASGGALAAAL